MKQSTQSATEQAWNQLLARDPGATFVYGVTTTGVYCRSTCPSRRPMRANTRFFADPHEARAAGFRACLRCRPDEPDAGAAIAEKVAGYLRAHGERQVSLAELGRVTGVSPFTVQRVFSKTTGMSPRAYANAFRAESFRGALQKDGAGRVTDAVYAAGFSAPSRAAHAAPLGMTAKRYRARGAGERIACLVVDAPDAVLGKVLVAATERGVCAVMLGENETELVAELERRFGSAEFVTAEDRNAAAAWPASLAQWTDTVLAEMREPAGARELPLDLRGTAFQARVWAALREIPCGETRTYVQLAAALGNPKAVRAVAGACGANPVAVAVPCHRVIGSSGKLTGYRWGIHRKKALLEREAQG